MKASAAKEKGSQPGRSRSSHRAPGPTTSYLKTRVRASRLYEAAFILAIAELTRRLHQAYGLAYDQPAADKVLPQNPTSPPPTDCQQFANFVDNIAKDTIGKSEFPDDVQRFMDRLATTFTEFGGATTSDILRGATNTNYKTFGSGGFASRFFEPDWIEPSGRHVPMNQVRHAVGGMLAGFTDPLGQSHALDQMNARENPNDLAHGVPDISLNGQTVPMGARLAGGNGRT